MTTTIAESVLTHVQLWIYDLEQEKFLPRGGFPEAPYGELQHDLLQTAIDERRSAVRDLGTEAIEIALPIAISESVIAAVLLTIRTDEGCKIAIERWTRTERDELGLAEACYRSLEHFARISPYVKFPRGSGLPGETWDDRSCRIIARIDQAKAFMRAAGARKEGLRYGLGIPTMKSEHELESVLLLLSTVDFPLLLSYETWKPSDDQSQLTLGQSCYALGIDAPKADQIAYGEGIVGECFASRLPVYRSEPDNDMALVKLFDQDARFALALPIFNGDQLVQVLQLIG